MTPIRERLLGWIVSLGVPARDRDAVLGDLFEESNALPPRERGRWRVLAGALVASRYQVEPYRTVEHRIAVLALAAAGVALLWGVPAASGDGLANPELFPDFFTRMVAAMWAASHHTAATAAGLLVGRFPGLPEQVSMARWHVAAVLVAVVASGAQDVVTGAISVGLLLGGVWLGDGARRIHADSANTHRL